MHIATGRAHTPSSPSPPCTLPLQGQVQVATKRWVVICTGCRVLWRGGFWLRSRYVGRGGWVVEGRGLAAPIFHHRVCYWDCRTADFTLLTMPKPCWDLGWERGGKRVCEDRMHTVFVQGYTYSLACLCALDVDAVLTGRGMCWVVGCRWGGGRSNATGACQQSMQARPVCSKGRCNTKDARASA